MKSDEFQIICKRKVEDILLNYNGREIVVWGAGEGGKIIKDIFAVWICLYIKHVALLKYGQAKNQILKI